MQTWANKRWGALIGGLIVILTVWMGLGVAALVVLFAIAGYFIGKFLDGELDIQEVRERAQERVGR